MRVIPSRGRRDPFDLDESTLERLLDGSVPDDDVPPGYRHVARALRVLRQRPTSGELCGEMRAIVLMRDALTIDAAEPPADELRPQRSARVAARRPLRVAVVGTIGALGLFGGLATANALPGPAQGIAADVLGALGIDLPSGGRSHAPEDGVDAGGGEDEARDAEVVETDEPEVGTPPSTAGKDGVISGLATNDDTSGIDKGAAVSGEASDGKSQAGQNGSPPAGPPDLVPAGGSGPGPPPGAGKTGGGHGGGR